MGERAESTLRGAAALLLLLPASCSAPPGARYELVETPSRAILTLPRAHEELEEILRRSGLPRDSFGISVLDLQNGIPVWEVNSDELMVVASNAKLVLAACALSRLGPDYQVETEIFHHQGSLWIRGKGDPSLKVSQLHAMMPKLVEPLRSRGFDGRVFLDTSWMAEYEDTNPDFSRSIPENAGFGPFNLDANVALLHLQPAGPASKGVQGLRPFFMPDPEGWRLIVQETPEDTTPPFDVAWNERDRAHEVLARPPLKPGITTLAIRKPAEHFGRVFAGVARAHGLEVREVGFGRVPDGAAKILSHRSPPLIGIVREMQVGSLTWVAQQTVMLLARQAGGREYPDGLRVLRDFLVREVGLKAGSFILENGAGLTRTPQLSAGQLVRLLANVHSRPDLREAFLSTLPIAAWSGTLSRRLARLPRPAAVSAKTGHIPYAEALSGYGSFANGRRFAFSILINNRRWLDAYRRGNLIRRKLHALSQSSLAFEGASEALQEDLLDALERTEFQPPSSATRR